MEKLKDCPFCGGDDLDCSFYTRDDHTKRRSEMQCRSCGATGPIVTVHDSYMGSEYPSVTAEAWNRRTLPEDAIREAAREIETFLEENIVDGKFDSDYALTTALESIIRRHLEGLG